jgi:hypothetical protein
MTDKRGSGLEPGDLIAQRYRVDRLLGEGALGRTVLARDERIGKDVAIKELLPSRLKRWKDFELFERECNTLRHLRHAGIPRYYDDFREGDAEDLASNRLFLVQEWVDGHTLDEVLADEGPLDEARVRTIAVEVLKVLDYLHSLSPPVIHRDLKPSNLMVDRKGRIKLIDFGAVREAVTADGVGSTIVGTLGYMPPEQYAGQSGPPTDVFALGATLVQLLTGREPHELFSGIHEFRLPSEDVDRRYPSAQAVLDDLGDQFLMVPKRTVAGALPIPHEIRPAPRPFPGFRLRDAYHGRSHLAVLLIAIFGVLLTTIFPLSLIALNQAAWAPLGVLGGLASLSMATAVSVRARREIGVYRQGIYTLGEVTGRFLSISNIDAESMPCLANLTYRYPVGDGFRHGCLSTTDKAYTALSPGDPVGVVYLPDDPDEHVMYAVPTKWAQKHVNTTRLLPAEPEG